MEPDKERRKRMRANFICTRCHKGSARCGFVKCQRCRDAATRERDRIESRTGRRGVLAEWKLRDLEGAYLLAKTWQGILCLWPRDRD
jgi:hypothetical protein